VTLIFSPGCKFGDVDAASLISALCSSSVATPKLSTFAQLAALALHSSPALKSFNILVRKSSPRSE